MKPISLRIQLLFFVSIFFLLPLFFLGVYFDHLSQEITANDMRDKIDGYITYKMELIERLYNETVRFTDWIVMDQSVISLMEREPTKIDEYDENYQRVLSDLTQQFAFNGITDYVPSFFLFGKNGLDIRKGVEASFYNRSDLEKQPWFQEYLFDNDLLYWGSLTDNYCEISKKKRVIPVIRTVNDSSTGESIGWLIIFFEDSFFKDILLGEKLFNNEQIVLKNISGNIISTNYTDETVIRTSNMFYEKSVVSNNIDWVLTYNVLSSLIKDKGKLVQEKIFFSFLLLCLSFILSSIVITRNIISPLEYFSRQVEKIAFGNGLKLLKFTSNLELWNLSKSINKMEEDIQTLIESKIDEEKERGQLEIKLLQSQITPHFLYNTLNTIKSMAVLQNSPGIEQMTVSLGRMLKESINKPNEKITLKEELRILDDYMHIQRIRYKGRIKLKKIIPDEDVLECLIVKYILQPLVENAIFHGLEPKNRQGEITLTLLKLDRHLKIEIKDNGLGMKESQLDKLKKQEYSSRNGGGMGISNVRKRIKMIYGIESDLIITSEENKYTQIEIVLPLEGQTI